MVRRIKYFSELPSPLKNLVDKELDRGFLEPFTIEYKSERNRAVRLEYSNEDLLVILDYGMKRDAPDDEDDDTDDDDSTNEGMDDDLDDDLKEDEDDD